MTKPEMTDEDHFKNIEQLRSTEPVKKTAELFNKILQDLGGPPSELIDFFHAMLLSGGNRPVDADFTWARTICNGIALGYMIAQKEAENGRNQN